MRADQGRRWLAPLVVAIAFSIVSAASSAPGPSPVTVNDPAGDSQTAPDVTRLALRQEGARVVYDLAIAGRADRFAEGEYVVFFVDSDGNAATGGGNAGADYLIEYEQRGDGVLRVYRHDPVKRAFAFERGFNASLGTLWGGRLDSPPNVWRFYFSPSMFGNGASFRFYARAESAGQGKNYTFDRVPDTGLATFVLADTTGPKATALPSAGRAGKVARLTYRVSDDRGKTREVLTVRRGAKTLATVRATLHPAVAGKAHSASWNVPATLKGVLRFCVRAFDAAGNASPQSCARLVIR